jgi:predicted ATPase/DNA-binding SARP family transcriptional activator
MSAGLRIELLGGFRVSGGSRVVEEAGWRLHKASHLVKLLALAPEHRLHRERLIDWLWPDLDPAAASNNLHSTLYVARRALAPAAGDPGGSLYFQRDVVALRPPGPLWIDVEAFETAATAARRAQDPEAYAAAVALYTGDLLPEDCYEEWTADRRRALRGLYLALLLELARLLEARGEIEPASEVLGRLVATEPAHEEAHVALIRLHAVNGQRHEALRQYRELRAALLRELDAEPAPASQQLNAEILAGHYPARSAQPAHRAPAAGSTLPAELVNGRAARRSTQERPGARPAHNLPVALSRFIGREQAIAAVERRLAQVRLLTLTGVGGGGKTRLALEVAADLLPRYPDGVWLVELATLLDPALVPQALASALDVREGPGHALAETLVHYLRGKQLLLVLDNCEHLVDACADLANALLRACPGIRILATSREALGLVGEAVWQVPPLSLPPDPPPGRQDLPPVEELARYEAIRLFVDRARLVDPAFALSHRNVPQVVQVCRRLDGLPLAIELAAARLKTLTLPQLAARLEDRLGLLTEGSRVALPRHRTLRGAIDWSYDLLSEPERALLRRLATFDGGFGLEAAEAICAGEAIETEAVVGLLSQLAEKSLVVADRQGDEARYWLLESIRDYCREKLEAAGETAALRRRHRDWYLALAEQAEPALRGPDQEAWLDRLEAEHDNLRTARDWCRVAGEGEPAQRLAGALCRFWLVRGYFSEGRAWLEDALAIASVAPTGATGRRAATGARAKALHAAGTLASFHEDHARSKPLLDESLRLFRKLRNKEGVAMALAYQGVAALDRGEPEVALGPLEEGLALFHALKADWGTVLALFHLCRVARARGDGARAVALGTDSLAGFRALGDKRGVAMGLHQLGLIAGDSGDRPRAAALLEESLALYRELGDTRLIAVVVAGVGITACWQSDYVRARACFEESLRLFRELGMETGFVRSLAGLGRIAHALGQPERAATLFAAAAALRESVGSWTPLLDPTTHEDIVSATRARLGVAAFAAAWAAGREMTRDQAVDYALSENLRSEPCAGRVVWPSAWSRSG